MHVVDALINTYLVGDMWKLSWRNEATHRLSIFAVGSAAPFLIYYLACQYDAGTIMKYYRGTSDLHIVEIKKAYRPDFIYC